MAERKQRGLLMPSTSHSLKLSTSPTPNSQLLDSERILFFEGSAAAHDPALGITQLTAKGDQGSSHRSVAAALVAGLVAGFSSSFASRCTTAMVGKSRHRSRGELLLTKSELHPEVPGRSHLHEHLHFEESVPKHQGCTVNPRLSRAEQSIPG